MCVSEKKVPTLWPQPPQILPNDDDERLARAEALEKENRWIDKFIERLAGALKAIHKK
jgi:hypothetical protein